MIHIRICNHVTLESMIVWHCTLYCLGDEKENLSVSVSKPVQLCIYRQYRRKKTASLVWSIEKLVTFPFPQCLGS